MVYVVLISIIALMALSVQVRLAVLHPLKTLGYAGMDTYCYIHDRQYDIYNGGDLCAYTAHFGGGKTLSLTQYVVMLYERYNNKRVYDRKRKKWVLQKVLILSNVELIGVEYFEKLESLKQIVECANRNKEIDEKNDTRTCVIVLLDEASSELNSRSFKSNIDANFLNALITSRHYHMSFYYSTQKFHLCDKLLRDVTQTVIWCDKHWRFLVQHYFVADEMEYATNPTLVQPYRRTGFFVTNKHYNSYDTLATVERLERSTTNGDMMSEAEILAMRGNFYGDNDNIMNPSRKLRRQRKRA